MSLLLTDRQEELLLACILGNQLAGADRDEFQQLADRLYDRVRQRSGGAHAFAAHRRRCPICQGRAPSGDAA